MDMIEQKFSVGSYQIVTLNGVEFFTEELCIKILTPYMIRDGSFNTNRGSILEISPKGNEKKDFFCYSGTLKNHSCYGGDY